MGSSYEMQEQTSPRPSFTADITARLQQLVTGWQGAERNHHYPICTMSASMLHGREVVTCYP
jgi:hypothetical protein